MSKKSRAGKTARSGGYTSKGTGRQSVARGKWGNHPADKFINKLMAEAKRK